MTEKEQAMKIAKAAPPLSDKELAAINAGYVAYIFRNRKKREIWTTCCGRHEAIPQKGYTDAQHAVMEAAHCGEDAGRGNYCSYAQRRAAEGDRRDTTPCPYCGANAYVKELGRTGSRKNLTSFLDVIVVRWYRGALWARAYYTAKRYKPEYSLIGRPDYQVRNIYRFKPGEAVCAYAWYGEFHGITVMDERPKKLPLPIQEPFSNGYNGARTDFAIIGLDEISKSPFRYCQHKEFFAHSGSYMRFLAVCCIYPRQVEMLMKSGMREAVHDLVHGHKWNAAAFDWEKTNPLESFQLSKSEMKDYLAGEKNLEALAYYKQFRRKKIKCEIAEVLEVMSRSPYAKEKSVIKRLKDHKIEPGRWVPYMLRETEAENSKKKRSFTETGALAQLWVDYIDAAVALGYDLTNPLMQMPKSIRRKHDKTVKAAAPVIAARLEKELGEKESKRLKQANARYGFAFGEYIIRAPINAEEIVNEGKALKHCVGGYAERHMNGKLTILFLRAAADPYKPLVTLEMNSDRLVQLHGYKNDVKAKIKPRKKYAAILDLWLEWVKAGSKRDKEGNPKLPKQNNKEVNVA